MNNKQINIKLIILPIVLILCIVILSFFFSKKIDYLKKEIDLVYFGNYVPVGTLYNIQEQYKTILKKRKISNKTKVNILKLWDSYYSSYHSKDEKKILKQINYRIKHNLKIKRLRNFKQNIKDIKYLIDYEATSAKKQRKKFLTNYTEISIQQTNYQMIK